MAGSTGILKVKLRHHQQIHDRSIVDLFMIYFYTYHKIYLKIHICFQLKNHINIYCIFKVIYSPFLGNFIVKVDPLPNSLVTVISPPWSSINPFVIVSPSPLPFENSLFELTT